MSVSPSSLALKAKQMGKHCEAKVQLWIKDYQSLKFVSVEGEP